MTCSRVFSWQEELRSVAAAEGDPFKAQLVHRDDTAELVGGGHMRDARGDLGRAAINGKKEGFSSFRVNGMSLANAFAELENFAET